MSSGSLPPPVANPDAQQLKLIEVFHYVMCGLAALGMVFLLCHFLFMSSIMELVAKNPQPGTQPVDPAAMYRAMSLMYGFIGSWGLVSLVANLVSGLNIRARRGRMISLIVAGFNCVNLPFGTVLGVFTFIVLLRPSMAGIYGEAPRATR